MKKISIFLGLLLLASPVQAAITVGTAPTSLVTTATNLAASTEKAVFEFALTGDAAETLSSVAVTVNSSTATSSDLTSVAVYKDDGDGVFDSGDAEAGSNTTVNVGSTTTVTTAANNTLTGAKFFVVLKTAAGWSGTDSVTVTLNANGIVASANSPTTTAVTTAALTAPDLTGPTLTSAVAVNKDGSTSGIEAGDKVVLTFGEATNKPAITAANIASTLVLNNTHSWLDGVASIGGASWNEAGTVLTVVLSGGTSVPTITAGDTVTVTGSVIKDAANNNATGTATLSGSFGVVDTTGPVLSSVVAKNTGGTDAKEAGDTLELTFGEATNKPVINAANVNTVLVLNNSHSWLDGAGALGTATWSTDGTKLTIALTAGTSVPTVAVGDTVTLGGSVIKDAMSNDATGSKAITGSFAGTITTPGDEDDFGKKCTSGIINGKLYKGEGSTIYLAAGCRLKPFRGSAVFHARGHKFQNILPLPSTTGIEISDKPALPAGGTLVKGTEKTVWFVTEEGKRKGFASENAFKRLGFNFKSVKQISDTDLAFLTADTAIGDNTTHPEGAVIKCTTSATVYMMKGNKKFAFTNPQPYLDRGHTWDAIAIVDCNAFPYAEGSNVN